MLCEASCLSIKNGGYIIALTEYFVYYRPHPMHILIPNLPLLSHKLSREYQGSLIG